MPLVAYGYGLDQLFAAAGGDGLIVELMADPDIVLDPDITITLEADEVVVTLDTDIDIEVD